MNIRQSPEYSQFIKSLGWQVQKVKGINIFIKKIPVLGSIIKIQRIEKEIPFEEIEKITKEEKAFQVILEPGFDKINPNDLKKYKYKPLSSPFIPTKTIIKNIEKSDEEILNSFSKNKKRDVFCAQKRGLLVKEGILDDFLKLKKEYLLKKFIIPFGVNKEIKLLSQAFKNKAKFVIASEKDKKISLAGAIILINEDTAYYWQAAATDKGKKLLAPTLVVWEALKLAKKEGCRYFDFEGIYDERFPQNKSWQGFTHFKKGFRGEEIIYPAPLVKTRLHITF
ncbi:peptidoglycan bridge formation glycyltransferase FemA/FemB family protein [Patescibacteria group bacterium]|nr:peptidoglycan bridge formation glycyltransferase FemA/FemB family protein [Patescibacteria group bacterium]